MQRQTAKVLGRQSGHRLAGWLAWGVLAAAAAVLAARPLHAQDAPDAAPQIRSAAQLDELVGPIALYADDLIGIVLPASTYPLQIVQAARFLDARAKDSTLEPDDSWDDSVVALLNYPEVVKQMNDDLDWTYALGEAVLNQRSDVLDAVQRFRSRAYTSGNLRSDDKQVVANDDNEITIKPANPQVVYVPYYEPERVVVYQSAPVFYYYPYAYPVYYYPYPVGYSFYRGAFWGVTTAFVIGWHSHHLNVYHCGFAGHPYYGHAYHDPFYVRNDIHVNVTLNRSGGVWNPGPRRDGRPFVRSDDHYVRTPGSVRTPTVARTPNPNPELRAQGRGTGAAVAQGRASGSAVTQGGQSNPRPSSAPARSGTYRNPGQTQTAAPPAASNRSAGAPRSADQSGSAATRERSATTPASPQTRERAATAPASPQTRERSSAPPQRYATPNRSGSAPNGGSQAEQFRSSAPPAYRGNGGAYRSGGTARPPTAVAPRTAPPPVSRPAPGNAGRTEASPRPTYRQAAPQDRSPRAESRSSAAPPQRDSSGAERGGQGGGSPRGAQDGGSYRGHGGGQSGGHGSSRQGSR